MLRRAGAWVKANYKPCSAPQASPEQQKQYLTVKKAVHSSGEILVSVSSLTSSGVFSPARANWASAFGMVAEKRSVWRPDGMPARIWGLGGRFKVGGVESRCVGSCQTTWARDAQTQHGQRRQDSRRTALQPVQTAARRLRPRPGRGAGGPQVKPSPHR